MTKFIKSITLSITVWFLVACSDDIIQEPSNENIKNPTAAQILGNPTYPAFSYGGYRGKSRQVAPSQEQLIEDLKILSAMGVKVLRTYNTSQFPLAPDLLAAITVLKNADPNFEMY
ncbi:MAG: exo-beta-1,3-glucanase, partial [Porticoccaceae bacterium]|nr:exo-beta-1,3-glucanase [Porticoccaceae bacterium]